MDAVVPGAAPRLHRDQAELRPRSARCHSVAGHAPSAPTGRRCPRILGRVAVDAQSVRCAGARPHTGRDALVTVRACLSRDVTRYKGLYAWAKITSSPDKRESEIQCCVMRDIA